MVFTIDCGCIEGSLKGCRVVGRRCNSKAVTYGPKVLLDICGLGIDHPQVGSGFFDAVYISQILRTMQSISLFTVDAPPQYLDVLILNALRRGAVTHEGNLALGQLRPYPRVRSTAALAVELMDRKRLASCDAMSSPRAVALAYCAIAPSN